MLLRNARTTCAAARHTTNLVTQSKIRHRLPRQVRAVLHGVEPARRTLPRTKPKTDATKPNAPEIFAALQTHRSRQTQSATNAATKTFLGFLELRSKYLIGLSGVLHYEYQKAMSLQPAQDESQIFFHHDFGA